MRIEPRLRRPCGAPFRWINRGAPPLPSWRRWETFIQAFSFAFSRKQWRMAAHRPRDAGEYAAALYEMLHRPDEQGLPWIAAERPPDAPEWAGVLDLPLRAGGPGALGENRSLTVAAR